MCYWGLCLLSPIPATSDTWLEVDDDETGTNSTLVYGLDASDPESGYGEPVGDYKGAKATQS